MTNSKCSFDEQQVIHANGKLTCKQWLLENFQPYTRPTTYET